MEISEPTRNLTLEDHERLVNALYEPGADVSRINAVITGYQRSQQGWHFADQLLQSQDSPVGRIWDLSFCCRAVLAAQDTLSPLCSGTSTENFKNPFICY